MPYIDFAALKEAVTIAEVANLLDLKLTKAGNQMRCECPVHGGGDRGMVITPGKSLFYCFKGAHGGDQLALYAHVNQIDVKQAAAEIAGQMGDSSVPATEASTVPNRSTVPSSTKRERTESQPTFDPAKFAEKLVYGEAVKQYGLTEEQAAQLAVGHHPQRKAVYFAVRYDNGEIAGFIGFRDGKLQLPPQWLPRTNVVPLKKRA